MADVYGDDHAARPLRLLESLLADIRLGTFDPDATRAGRFVSNVEPVANPTSGASNAVVVVDDGGGVDSVDGGESAPCSFERVSEREYGTGPEWATPLFVKVDCFCCSQKQSMRFLGLPNF